jgi:hypothetical protein
LVERLSFAAALEIGAPTADPLPGKAMSGVEMSGALAALTGTVAIAGPAVVAVPPTTATCARLNEADKTIASDNLLNIFTSRRASLPAFITRRKSAITAHQTVSCWIAPELLQDAYVPSRNWQSSPRETMVIAGKRRQKHTPLRALFYRRQRKKRSAGVMSTSQTSLQRCTRTPFSSQL